MFLQDLVQLVENPSLMLRLENGIVLVRRIPYGRVENVVDRIENIADYHRLLRLGV
jgi:hypothetical protein